MAYMVTFHGVSPDTFDGLKQRVEGYGFEPTDDAAGVLEGDGVDVAFSYDAGAGTLQASVRRAPLLMTRGHVYGLIADTLVELGADHHDPLM